MYENPGEKTPGFLYLCTENHKKLTDMPRKLNSPIASTDVGVLQYAKEITVVRNGTYYSTKHPYRA